MKIRPVRLAWCVGVCVSIICTLLSSSYAVTFTVNNTSDTADANPGDGTCADAGGACTLRAAIDEANALGGADEIMLPAGTYTITQAGISDDLNVSGDFDINEDLRITGVGAATIVDGGALDRVFQVTGGNVAVQFFSFTIQNGLTDELDMSNARSDGGGIRSAGSVELFDMEIINNRTANGGAVISDGGDGAGIFHVGTLLRITRCRIAGNQTGDGESNLGDGGNGAGLYTSFNLQTIVSQSVFENNRCGDGIDDTNGGEGGGIYVGDSGRITMWDCTVQSNRAGDGGDMMLFGSGGSGGHGGGMFIAGEATLTRSTLANNQAGNGGDGGDSGGRGGDGAAIYLTGLLSVENSTLSANIAGDGGDGTGQATPTGGNGGNGGAMYMQQDVGASATIVYSTIAFNEAGRPGAPGGIAGTVGGVLADDSLSIGHTIFQDNLASGGNTNDVAINGGFSTSLGWILLTGAPFYMPGGNTASNKVGVSANLLPLAADPQAPVQGAAWNPITTTLVHPITTSSPAFDCGDPSISGAPATDQRLEPRVSVGQIDIGAVELQPIAINLTLEKDMPACLLPGEIFEITLTVSNAGPVDAPCLTAFDFLSTPLSFVGSSQCTENFGTVNCAVSNLAAGAITSLTFSAVVDSDASYGFPHDNFASLQLESCDPLVIETNNTDNDAFFPYSICPPNLTVSKTVDAPAHPAGGIVTYTVEVVNEGTIDGLDVLVVDPLHPDFTLVAVPPFCSLLVANQLLCDLGDVPALTSTSFTFQVELDLDTPYSVIWNAVEVGLEIEFFGNDLVSDANGGFALGDADDTNNVSAVPFNILRIADVHMTKTNAQSSYKAGDPISWTITLTNAGPADVCGASLVDAFPAGVNNIGWTCTASPTNGGDLTQVDADDPSGEGQYLGVAAHPDNLHVFASSSIGVLYALLLDPVSGLLSPGTSILAPQIDSFEHLLVSPDGLHVYGLNEFDDRIVSFEFDPVGPVLSVGTNNPVASSTNFTDMAVSPDGAHLYVLDGGNLRVLSRDLLTGELTLSGTTSLGTFNPRDILVSPDGVHVYVLHAGSVDIFDRNATTGLLTTNANSPFSSAGFTWSMFDISPDGRHLYIGSFAPVGGSALATVDRTPATGALTGSGNTPASSLFESVVASPDGKSVYSMDTGSTGGIVAFSRDQASGATTLEDTIALFDPFDVTVMPNSRHLFSSVSQSVRSIQRAGFTGCENTSGTGDLSELIDIAAGGMVTFEVTGVVAACEGSLTNTAEFYYPTNVISASSNTAIFATHVDTVIPCADLAITKSEIGASVFGLPASFNLLVTNNGPCTAVNVIVTDFLDTNFFTSGTTQVMVGALAPNTSTNIIITAMLKTEPIGSFDCDLLNIATVTNDIAESTMLNNTSELSTVVDRLADLDLSKTGPTTAAANSTIVYSLILSNAGPSLAPFPQVADTPPPGFAFVGSDCGAFEQFGDVVWAPDAMEPGAVTNCLLTFETTNCCLDVTVTNQARIVEVGFEVPCEGSFDLNSSNDIAEVITTILPDTEPPTFTCPGDIMVADRSMVPPPALPLAASDTCHGTIPVFLVSSNEISNGCGGQVIYVYGASDSCNNSSMCTQTVTYGGAMADVSIEKLLGGITSLGEPIQFTLLVSNAGPCTALNVVVTDVLDPDFFSPAGTVTFNLGDLAPGASTNLLVNSSLLSPPNGGPLVSNTATVTNDVPDPAPSNNSSTVSFVPDAPLDLEILKSGPTTAVAGASFVYSLELRNNGPNDAPEAMVIDVLPPGLTYITNSCDAVFSFDTLSWSVSNLMAGASTFCSISVVFDNCCVTTSLTNSVFTFLDSGGGQGLGFFYFDTNFSNDTDEVVTLVTADEQAPVFISSPADIFVECGETFSNSDPVVAVDNCSTVVVTQASVTNFFCESSLTFVITNTWTATDVCGNTSAVSQVIQVEDTTDPMIIDCPADQEVGSRAEVPGPDVAGVSASDSCSAITISVSTNEVQGTCDGRVEYTYTVFDACGHAASCTQTITFPIFAPTRILSCPSNLTVGCISDVPAGAPELVVATNACYPVVVTVQTNQQGDSCVGVVTYVYQVDTGDKVDVSGFVTTCTQTVTYADVTPPVITSCPADTSVSCFDLVPDANPEGVVASDTCGGTTTILASANFSDDLCSGTVEYIYEVRDDCGNIASCTQQISYTDTEPPVILDCPPDQMLPGGSSLPEPDPSGVNATDSCSQVFVSVLDSQVFSNPCSTVALYLYEVADDCGNIAICTQQITVGSFSSPTLIGCPGDVAVTCLADVPPPAAVTATDVCESVTVVVTTNAMITSAAGSIIYTYTVSNSLGMVASCSQTVTVVGSTGPVLSLCPADLTVTCLADVPPPATVTATDACETVSVVVTTNTMITSAAGSIVYIYTASNSLGMVASCTQTVTVVGSTGPVLSQCPADLTVTCLADVPPPATFIATDACETVSVVVTTNTMITSAAGSIVYIYTASNSLGMVASCTQTVTVIGSAGPALDQCPADLTVVCRDDVPAAVPVMASDACETLQPTLTTNFTGDACVGAVQYIWAVTNAQGAVAACTQTIDFADSDAPTLGGVPAALTLPGGATCSLVVEALTGLSSSDNCDPAPQITQPDVGSTLVGPGPHTITVFADDACGNRTTETVIISLECNAAIEIEKTVALGAGAICPGQEMVQGTNGTPITYCFEVHNTGGSFLGNLVLADPAIGFNSTIAVLAPGASTTLSANATIAGDLVNSASITASPSDSDGSPIAGLLEVTDQDTAAVQELVCIGNFVWDDLNYNGEQDAGEPGIPDVTITLESCMFDEEAFRPGARGTPPTAVTDANGFYKFLARPGEYQVRLTLPNGYLVTLLNAASDTVDSDIDPNTLLSACVGPLGGGTGPGGTMDVDVGLFRPAQLGGTVWVDLDNDGNTIGDNLSVLGIPGVAIRFSQLIGGNPVLIDTLITGPNAGNSGFFATNVLPGDFLIEVDINTLPPSMKLRSTPLSYTRTMQSGDSSLINLFGFAPAPTAITLSSLAAAQQGSGTRITWETETESDVLGYQVFAANGAQAARRQVGSGVVLAQGDGSTYQLGDTLAASHYWLLEIGTDLSETWHGPLARTVSSAAGEAGLVLLPVASPDRVNVVASGQVLPAIELDGALLIYLQQDAALEIVAGAPVRMTQLDAAPHSATSDLLLLEAKGDDTLAVQTRGQRLLVHGAQGNAQVVDITDPSAPIQWLGARLGDEGIYLKASDGRSLLIRTR